MKARDSYALCYSRPYARTWDWANNNMQQEAKLSLG